MGGGAGEHRNLNPELQPMQATTEVTIEPNDKYKEVILGEWPHGDTAPDTEEEFIEESEHHETTEAYLETIENAPTYEEIGEDPEEIPVLSWNDVSPASDPDLLAKIATYFNGMAPDEPKDLLRAKCRLLDVEDYTNVQIAAQQELRNE